MRKLIFTLFLITSSFLLNAQTTVFSEDFETPPDSVTSYGTPGWFTCSRIQAGGVNCDSSAIIAPGDISYLETDPFDCTNNFFVTLSFENICKIEFFDHGTIEISIDGGGSWEKLVDDAGGLSNNCVYMGTGLFRTQGSRFCEASYSTWQPGQILVPDNSWWKTEVFDISTMAGGQPDVRLRFKNADFNNSGGAGRTGWYVDNILVVASFCELIPPVAIGLAPTYPPTVYNLGPFTVNISATDASTIGSVILSYSIDGVVQTPSITMTNPAGDSVYTAMIPAVDTFQTVCYMITIMDGSFCQNVSYFPGPTDQDSICFFVEGGITFPYCDNFDISTGLWSATTASPGTEWELGTPAYGATNSAHSPPNSWDINLTTAYTNNAAAFLQSPEFSFVPVGAGATLEFWQNRNTEGGWDGTRLEYTTDTVNGPWTILGTVGCLDCVNWYTDLAVNCENLPGWEGNSGGWIKSSIILDATFNNLPQVWFRFVFCSDGSVIYDGMSIDGFCLSLPQPNDVGVSAINLPGPTGPAGNCVNVEVEVKNYGLNTQTTFPVTYVMTSMCDTVTQTATYTGNLTPGATATFTFPVCDTICAGNFTICAWTGLPGDANNFNDTVCNTNLGIPVLVPTSCDDMESGNIGYQTTSTNIPAAEWQLGAPAFGATFGANSGTNAWDINLNNGYGVNATAHLITPIYDLAGTINSYLSFYRNQLTAPDDGLRIYYDFNGSGIWNVLGIVNDLNGYNWYNNANLNFSGQPGWDGGSNGWKESRYYLQDLITASGLINPFIQFRFEFVSGFNGAPNDGVSIDDICLKQPGPDDVGVVAISSPTFNAPAGNSVSVDVLIRNFGSLPQTGFPVYYEATQMGVPVASGNAIFTNTINPGQTLPFNLPNLTVPSGQFDFCAWTELTGDTDAENDTSCIISVGIPVIVLSYTTPYFDDFDVTNVGWSTNVTGNPATVWELGPPAFGQTSSAHSAPNAWDVNLTTAYGPSAGCDLYSPIFDLTNAVDAKLSFWRNHSTEQNWDGVRIEYSLNSTGIWTLLGTGNALPPCWVNWYNLTNLNCSGQPGWAGATGGWIKTEANCLPMFDGQTVQFRLVFCSDNFFEIDGFSVDDWRLDIPVPLTAAPVAINTNTINNSFIFPGQSVQFTGNIFNPGTTPLTSVDATITITEIPSGVNVLTVTDPIAYAPALPSQSTLPHIFSQLWTAVPGVYEVCVITSNPNGGIDLNPFDDTTCITISVFDSVSITSGPGYCTDFETGPQWVSVNAVTYASSLNDWEIGTPSQTIINDAHSGANAWTIDLDENYSNRDTSGLFTPVFSIDSTKCYKLSFWHKYDTEPFADGGTVEFSTDFAQTWQQLGFASGTPGPWFNTPFITALGGSPGLPGWSGTEVNWVQAEKEANYPSGSTIIFRFRFASDNTVNNYEGWAIDDFCFQEVATTPCLVSINDLENNGVMLGQNYPNPFNGTSTVEYVLPGSGQVKISITDIIGQEIAVPVDGEKAAGMHSFTINSRALGSGIYYYTLDFDGQQITRKMIITE